MQATAFLGVQSAPAGIYSHLVTGNVADQGASTLAASTYGGGTAMPAVKVVGRTFDGTRVFAAVGAGASANAIVYCAVSAASAVTGCAAVEDSGSPLVAAQAVTGFAFDDGNSWIIAFSGTTTAMIYSIGARDAARLVSPLRRAQLV